MPDESQANRVIGDYEILREVGRGGMGVVYKAHERALRRTVALKVLPPSISADIAFVKRFEREARFAASLNHPNIVSIYTVGKHEDVRYISMEYVKGKTLTALIREAGRLSIARALEITLQAADALAAAHKVDMVHRDVKPDNIMIDEAGRVKVMDFGLARGLHSTTQLTAQGAVVGTPRYMSPEQCEGQKPDHRSDIYSLGIVLFEMLTGQTPYSAETPLALMRQIVDTPLPSIQEQSADVPPQICSIIYRMTAKRPEDRYENAEILCEDIRAFLEGTRPQNATPIDKMTDVLPPGTETPTPPAGPAAVTPTAVSVPVDRGKYALIGAVAILLVVVAVLAVWLSRSRSAPPEQVLHVVTTPAPVELAPIPAPPVVPPREVAPPETRPQSPVFVTAEGEPQRLVFETGEVVLDPAHESVEVGFRAEPEEGSLKGVSWYAGGSLSVWPREHSVLIKTDPIDLGLGQEAIYKVIARYEKGEVARDLGTIQVRLQNPINLMSFRFDPASVDIGPDHPNANVGFELLDAHGKAAKELMPTFQLAPGNAPIQVVRDGENALRISLNTEARLSAPLEAKVTALVNNATLAELPIRIASSCQVTSLNFASDGVLLTNSDRTSEVFFDVGPAGASDSSMKALTFDVSDARITLNRISRNVIEVSLAPSTSLSGIASETATVTAWSCGNAVGTLHVEMLAFTYTPQIRFPISPPRLTNTERLAEIHFDVEPQGIPRDMLDAISFRADNYDLAVTRKGAQDLMVGLRQSVALQGTTTQMATVSAWYEGENIGTLSVELVPFSNLPRVVFLSGTPRLTNTERQAKIPFDIAPPGASNTVLDELRFRADTYEVAVNRKSAREVEVLLGPFVRLQSGQMKEIIVSARYRNVTVGEVPVQLMGPSTIESVEASPARVSLTPSTPTAYVSLTVRPPGTSAEDIQKLEFVMPENNAGLSWKRTRTGELIVSLAESGFGLGEERDSTLEIRSNGATLGKIDIHASRPYVSQEVRFTPVSLILSREQTEARVSFSTIPEGLVVDGLEWTADAGLQLLRVGERMLQVTYTGAANTATPAGELKVTAQLGSAVLGTLPVRIGASGRLNYDTVTFDQVTVTYPREARLGQEATITVESVNTAQSNQIGTLVVSIAGCGAVAASISGAGYDVYKAGGRTVNQFRKEGAVWRRTGLRKSPEFMIAERYTPNWRPGERQRLSFPVTFSQAGSAQLYVRATFAVRDGTETVVHTNYPATGVEDQQGLPCMPLTVTVTS